ncbi:ABC transporter permease [Paraconexibacter sp.]|uniref:ABC transporter permease n=1 Tax=Paraconexibacter sp. TaxID=2949640 RepID=UPI0035671DA4
MARRALLTARRRRQLLPYAILVPGVAWLVVFFAIPVLNQVYVSLESGTIEQGYAFDWNWSSYGTALSDYQEQFLRSLFYAGTATVLALVIAFPLVYFVAFRGGRYKTVLLALIVLPLFMNFLMRTVAWQTILQDDGFVADTMRSLGILEEDGRLLATRTAVIAGLTYNFLPFMALPIYAALEGVDRRLIEAATDLYATRWQAFRRITVPLAMPGIVAGSLLTFIPALGDYVNASLLGSSRETMIGNVIQSKFLVLTDYPTAAALSFLLMLFIVVLVAIYIRVLGRRSLFEAAAA